jgi:ubiquinone biosynthesis protein
VAEPNWPALKPYRPRQLVREFARRCGASSTWPPNAATPSACRQPGAAADVVIPRVHWAYTSERVNVQDFIDGVPGSDLDRA